MQELLLHQILQPGQRSGHQAGNRNHQELLHLLAPARRVPRVH